MSFPFVSPKERPSAEPNGAIVVLASQGSKVAMAQAHTLEDQEYSQSSQVQMRRLLATLIEDAVGFSKSCVDHAGRACDFPQSGPWSRNWGGDMLCFDDDGYLHVENRSRK
nr:hypothetical protein CFP56_64573 [Quercus suber]